MPRFRLDPTPSNPDSLDPDLSDHDPYHSDRFDQQPEQRRRRTAAPRGRLVADGKSGRFDADIDRVGADLGADSTDATTGLRSTEPSATEPYSSYDVAAHGPSPVPDWLITSFSARDTSLGVVKTGKEADVSLLDRSLPGGPGCLLAVKTYRDSQHRMFHRDSGYQEGRRTRRSRENRAMAARTTFGRDLLSAKWAGAEFGVLSALWTAGARVPYPVQLLGSELMMEFIGAPDGVAAQRLAAVDGTGEEFTALWHDLVRTLETLAELGLTHGDLSPYNVLVQDGLCVVIDLPQAVDVVANPQGDAFLDRDCRVIADFFSRRGVLAADGELLALHLGSIARGRGGNY